MLAELRRLQVKVDRAGYYRSATEEDRAWCHRVADVLEQLVLTGESVLSGGADPRARRRVRKREALF